MNSSFSVQVISSGIQGEQSGKCSGFQPWTTAIALRLKPMRNFRFQGFTCTRLQKQVQLKDSRIQVHIIFLFSIAHLLLLGLDLNDDVEGTAIRSAMATGDTTTSDPFDARVDLPPSLGGFKKLMGLFSPIYSLNSSLTISRNDNFAGCLVSMIAFHPMVNNILANLDILNIDVFLFWLKPDRNGSLSATYVAHFESKPENSRPRINATGGGALKPEDVDGDIVSGFVSRFDLTISDKTFRLISSNRW
uniref:Uncharacterized protein n=1 Tax=Cryptomonas curvata TaxID=233186 RepID=A0A7S0M516_9CRYP|mmetsp:Transcript_2503/g.5253  ORF Transcript_2503/g.5253 Transcript_2503/m.5253 type:complete len:248 (+) Transcript_2503:299-1042(+)|eukprot:CAMPEP_0172179938 /NCGR_PEP_ID=MMETSP1050-20130122/16913_1 /TAXON_ID=233186 /ORGANISM="Cryptomonas curvata, Strain CCAP979/52" /LENGTH=247 /DNA_ID=CAMNT_0012852911 /DNA_START=288 /DNA_END=1031 /DNA_ORIENTATION=+